MKLRSLVLSLETQFGEPGQGASFFPASAVEADGMSTGSEMSHRAARRHAAIRQRMVPILSSFRVFGARSECRYTSLPQNSSILTVVEAKVTINGYVVSGVEASVVFEHSNESWRRDRGKGSATALPDLADLQAFSSVFGLYL